MTISLFQTNDLDCGKADEWMTTDIRRRVSDKASALISKLHLPHEQAKVELTVTEASGKRKLEWPPPHWFTDVTRGPSPQPSPNSLAPAPCEHGASPRKLTLSSSDGPITLAGASTEKDGDVQLVEEPADMHDGPAVLANEPEEIISEEPHQIVEEDSHEISDSPNDIRAPELQITPANENGPQAGPSNPSASLSHSHSPIERVSPMRFPEKTPSKQGFPFPEPPRHPEHRKEGPDVKETLGARTSTHHDGTRMLNQYILLQTLGRGAFGLVLEAIDAETGEEFAIKELNRARLRRRAQKEAARRAREVREAVGSSNRPEAEAMSSSFVEDERTATQIDALYLVRNEVCDCLVESVMQFENAQVAIMKKVNHPNVVRLYEVLDAPSEDALYMVLELCRGGPIMSISLDPRSPSKPLAAKEAHDFFRQIVSGVSYLHANEIVHHDIKTVKLVDFGVSAIFEKPGDDSFKDGTSAAGVASPAFAAPEQFGYGHQPGSTKGIHGMAADIWSLGVTLVCMLTGRLPFEDDSMMGLYDAITTKEYAPPNIPDSLDPQAKDLIAQLLEKDPEKRIKMNKLREHPWITLRGKRPLPPIGKDAVPITPVTQADLDDALFVGMHSLRQQFHDAVAAARAASKQHAEQYGDRIGDGKRRAFFRALRQEIVTRGAATRRDVERSWLEFRERSKSRSSVCSGNGRDQSPRRIVSRSSFSSAVPVRAA